MNTTGIEDCTAFSILQEESRKAVEEELYLKYSVDISRATENVDE